MGALSLKLLTELNLIAIGSYFLVLLVRGLLLWLFVLFLIYSEGLLFLDDGPLVFYLVFLVVNDCDIISISKWVNDFECFWVQAYIGCDDSPERVARPLLFISLTG